MVTVKNVKGSSRFNNENWIQYWSEQKGYRPFFCSACGQLKSEAKRSRKTMS